MSTLSIDGSRFANSSVSSVGGTQHIRTASDANQEQDVFAGLQGAGGSGAAASVDISKPAQLFSKLQQLQTSDPAKYKQTLTEASSKLRDAANQAGSSDEGKFLNALADKFDKAAAGDLSALKPPSGGPPPGAGGQGGPPSGASALYGQAGGKDQQILSSLSTSSTSHKNNHTASSTTKSTLDSIFDAIDKATSKTASTTA